MSHSMTIMGVTLLIWIGLFLYLVRLDLRLTALEKRKRRGALTSDTPDGQ